MTDKATIKLYSLSFKTEKMEEKNINFCAKISTVEVCLGCNVPLDLNRVCPQCHLDKKVLDSFQKEEHSKVERQVEIVKPQSEISAFIIFYIYTLAEWWGGTLLVNITTKTILLIWGFMRRIYGFLLKLKNLFFYPAQYITDKPWYTVTRLQRILGVRRSTIKTCINWTLFQTFLKGRKRYIFATPIVAELIVLAETGTIDLLHQRIKELVVEYGAKMLYTKEEKGTFFNIIEAEIHVAKLVNLLRPIFTQDVTFCFHQKYPAPLKALTAILLLVVLTTIFINCFFNVDTASSAIFLMGISNLTKAIKQEERQPVPKPAYLYAIQVTKDSFSIHFKEVSTGQSLNFQSAKDNFIDLKAISKLIDGSTLVGYNNLRQDDLLLLAIIYKSVTTQETLWNLTQLLSQFPTESLWKLEKRVAKHLGFHSLVLPRKSWCSIDLYAMNFKDNEPISLLASRLQCENINDLDPNNRLTILSRLFEAVQGDIAIREWIKKTFGVDATNIREPNISEQVYLKEYLKATPAQKLPIPPNQKEIDVAQVLDPYWKTLDPQRYPQTVALVKKLQTVVLQGKENKNGNWYYPPTGVPITLNDTQFVTGNGGLRTKNQPCIVRAGDGKVCLYFDFKRYYPHIAKRLEACPRHLGSIIVEVMKKLLTMSVSQDGTAASGSKLILNAGIGRTQAGFSKLHDPECFFKITINGQIYMFHLLEHLFQLVGVKILYVNTDGAVIEMERGKVTDCETYIKEWCQKLGFIAKIHRCGLFAMRDENNYLVVSEQNEIIEAGGIFVEDQGISRHANIRIVTKAATAYLREGIPLEQTINKSENPFDFLLTRHSNHGFAISGKAIGTVARFIIAKQGERLLTYTVDGKEEQVDLAIGSHILLCPDLTTFNWENLDREAYIELAHEMLSSLSEPLTQTRQRSHRRVPPISPGGNNPHIAEVPPPTCQANIASIHTLPPSPPWIEVLYNQLGIEGQLHLYEAYGGSQLNQRPLLNPITGKDEKNNPSFSLKIKDTKVVWKNYNPTLWGDLYQFLAIRYGVEKAVEILNTASTTQAVEILNTASTTQAHSAEPKSDNTYIEAETISKQLKARWMWYVRSRPVPSEDKDHLVNRYLARRGIHVASQARFALLYCNGQKTPCMLHQVVDAQGNFQGVMRTFIDEESTKTGKAIKKMCLGPCRGGSVHFGELDQDTDFLIVCEGIETAMSIWQAIEKTIPVWACLGTEGLKAISIPRGVRCVYIYADSDANLAGQEAAWVLSENLLAQGVKVYCVYPTEQNSLVPAKVDFNDLLQLDPSGELIEKRAAVAKASGIDLFYPFEWPNRTLKSHEYVEDALRSGQLVFKEGNVYALTSPTGSGKRTVGEWLLNNSNLRIIAIDFLIRLTNQTYDSLDNGLTNQTYEPLSNGKKKVIHYRKNKPVEGLFAQALSICLPSFCKKKEILQYFINARNDKIILLLDEVHEIALRLFTSKEMYLDFINILKDRVAMVVAMTATMTIESQIFLSRLAQDLKFPLSSIIIERERPKAPCSGWTYRRVVDKTNHIIQLLAKHIAPESNKGRCVVIEQSREYIEKHLLPAVHAHFPHLQLKEEIDSSVGITETGDTLNVITAYTDNQYEEGPLLTIGSPSLATGISMESPISLFIVCFDDYIATPASFEQTLARVRHNLNTEIHVIVRHKDTPQIHSFDRLYYEEFATFQRMLDRVNGFVFGKIEFSQLSEKEQEMVLMASFVPFQDTLRVYDPTYLTIQCQLGAQRKFMLCAGAFSFLKYFQQNRNMLSGVEITSIQPINELGTLQGKYPKGEDHPAIPACDKQALDREIQTESHLKALHAQAKAYEVALVEATPACENYKHRSALAESRDGFDPEHIPSAVERKLLEIRIAKFDAQTADVNPHGKTLSAVKRQASRYHPLSIINSLFYLFRHAQLAPHAPEFGKNLWLNLKAWGVKPAVLFQVASGLWNIRPASLPQTIEECTALGERVLEYLLSIPDNDFRTLFGGATLQTKRWIRKAIMRFWGAEHRRVGREKRIVFVPGSKEISLSKGMDHWMVLQWATREPYYLSLDGREAPPNTFIEEAPDYQVVEQVIKEVLTLRHLGNNNRPVTT